MIEKCSKLVSFIRRSTVAAKAVKSEKKGTYMYYIKYLLMKVYIDDILNPFIEATDFVQVGCVSLVGCVLTT